MKKSPPLAIRSIRLDLGEALGELEDLWARIQIAATATWTPSGPAAAAPTSPSPGKPTSAAPASHGFSSLLRGTVWGDEGRQTPTRA